MKHIIFFSGGIGSYITAKRVINTYGTENVELLFTDTLIEDEDLYRFIDEAAIKLGVKLTKIADGRTPWEVAKDVKFIPNSRIAQCSHLLKQKTAEIYIKHNYSPEECILYLGIDWTEQHRQIAPIKNWSPYNVKFPLCEEPFLEKNEMLRILSEEDNIEIPRLYKMGFYHNNCGGFCFRAGIGHFKNLLEQMPERYKLHENNEKEMREFLSRNDISILRRVRNGKKVNLTLEELRNELENAPHQLSLFELTDFGGCGCFVNDYNEEKLNEGMGNDPEN